ncbi:MAG: cyclic nucleotide-binding domain-containing protein [Verrucomicrobiales bacterium]
MNADSLAHIANLLFGAAYLVRGILWLRVLSIVACVLMAFFNYYAPPDPLWVAIYWNIFFANINAVQVWLLLRERGSVSFSEDEKELYETMFRQMSPVEFMKILRICKWESVTSGTTIIERNSKVSELRLIYNGSVLVTTESGEEIELRDGTFLGELAFVSGSPASGDVEALSPTRLIAWSFDELHGLFLRNPEIKSRFQSLISADLASKLIPKGGAR